MLRHLTLLILLIVSGLLMFTGNQQPSKAQSFDKGKSYPDFNNLTTFHWQSLAKEDSLSYREVMKITDQYFKKHPEQREKQEESFKHYLRWKILWQDRMTKTGKSYTGPRYARQMLEQFYRRSNAVHKKGQKRSFCQSNYFTPKWQLLGPTKKYYNQLRGWMECVSVNPNDTLISRNSLSLNL